MCQALFGHWCGGQKLYWPSRAGQGTRAPKEMMWQQGQCDSTGHEGAQDPSAGTKALFWFGKEPPPPTHSVLGIPAATTSPCPPVPQQCPYRVLHPVNPARKEEKVSVRTHQSQFSLYKHTHDATGMRKSLPRPPWCPPALGAHPSWVLAPPEGSGTAQTGPVLGCRRGHWSPVLSPAGTPLRPVLALPTSCPHPEWTRTRGVRRRAKPRTWSAEEPAREMVG